MTTRVESYRNHCRKMAESGHAPSCPWSNPARARRESGAPIWVPDYHDKDGLPVGRHLAGFAPEIPPCDGDCIPDHERALWRQLADEADAYLDTPLFEAG